ncbi:MAG TPA: hypothetical protein VGM34_03910 [Chlamydiales bacterium]
MATVNNPNHHALVQYLETLQVTETPQSSIISSLFPSVFPSSASSASQQFYYHATNDRSLGGFTPSAPGVIVVNNNNTSSSSTSASSKSGIEISQEKSQEKPPIPAWLAPVALIVALFAAIVAGCYGNRLRQAEKNLDAADILNQLKKPHGTEAECHLCSPVDKELTKHLHAIYKVFENSLDEQFGYAWGARTLLLSSVATFAGAMYAAPWVATTGVVAVVASLTFMLYTYGSHYDDEALKTQEMQRRVLTALTLVKSGITENGKAKATKITEAAAAASAPNLPAAEAPAPDVPPPSYKEAMRAKRKLPEESEYDCKTETDVAAAEKAEKRRASQPAIIASAPLQVDLD